MGKMARVSYWLATLPFNQPTASVRGPGNLNTDTNQGKQPTGLIIQLAARWEDS